MTEFQVEYQHVKDDNLVMMEKISYLEEKLSTHSNSNEQILKNVQEYKILEDHTNSIWQSKINKFEQVLQTEIETKMNLIKTSLNRQFAQNKYVLNRFFDHYTLILNLMNTVNDWIENLIDIKLFVITNWINKRNNIQEVLNDQQLQYTKYLEILNSNAVDKFKMTSIQLTFPVLENISEQNVECIIKTILMVCSIIHYNFMMYLNELGCELNREEFVQNIKHLLKTIQWNISPEVILNVEIAEKLPTIICEKDMPQMEKEQLPSNDSENLEQKDCIIIENEEKFIESNEVIHKENVYHEISIHKEASKTLSLPIEKEITNSIVNDDTTKDISNPSVTDYFYNGNNDDIDNACSFNNQSDYTSNILKNECRLMYKVGLNKLVKIMLLNYSGTFE
ncbi:PREDICTED: uncharacterized protein LOC105362717 [Ceratosolen solmsi marchali]|uniref:Uncharacterized protein LOC105362717 n=1 Tax=Ceratosolen solmsi marchali TaxID=326594 RepID=A0AAJ6YI55_9HYME|nr:PREDICTED: uncharacterized protein LOC105362717 [Ceratosolen solmsi marchali]